MSTPTHQHAVNQFLLAIGKSLPLSPQQPAAADLTTQLYLLLEEFQELLRAAGFRLQLDAAANKIVLESTGEPFDLVRVVDGCADISVVNTGLLSLCGVEAVPVLAEVDQNNLAKTSPNGGGRLDKASGKFIKPANHPAPDLRKVLQAQGWRPPG